mmetsp:Transcript_108/g.142  ORF Transcript_108/g.142 Transcript_108/m.142 type:complete len:160 (+) Transcript_108:243-722(+)
MSNNKPTRVGYDNFIHNLGVHLGIKEGVAAIVLAELDLLQYEKDGGIMITYHDWVDFKALFKISTKRLEISPYKVKGSGNKRIRSYFAKFGECKYDPTYIIKNQLHYPTKMVSRSTTKFVCNEIRMVLKQSNKLYLLFSTNHYQLKNKEAEAKQKVITN